MLAQQAQIERAYYLWKSGEKAQALSTLERFIKLHPTSPALDYAYYLQGIVNFNENVGLFSGFMRALGGDESFEAQPHLKCLLDLEKFQADYQLFFRDLGEDDQFRSTFDQDDAFCARLGADPAHLPNHVRKLYPGVHDWNVWRRCLHDFAQMIF